MLSIQSFLIVSDLVVFQGDYRRYLSEFQDSRKECSDKALEAYQVSLNFSPGFVFHKSCFISFSVD
jgi:hypothetical protein